MKSPLTRRREARILAALHAIGPLDDWHLYEMLNAYRGTLNKALISLAAEGRIIGERHWDLIEGRSFTWSLPAQPKADAGGE